MHRRQATARLLRSWRAFRQASLRLPSPCPLAPSRAIQPRDRLRAASISTYEEARLLSRQVSRDRGFDGEPTTPDRACQAGEASDCLLPSGAWSPHRVSSGPTGSTSAHAFLYRSPHHPGLRRERCRLEDRRRVVRVMKMAAGTARLSRQASQTCARRRRDLRSPPRPIPRTVSGCRPLASWPRTV